MTETPRTEPEPLGNETLQRMIDEQIHTNNMQYGPEQGLDLPVLDDLSLYIVQGFDFGGMNLQGIYAYKTTFHQCCFVATDLYHASFDETIASRADFRGAVLVKAIFSGADVSGANFDGANLVQTEFMHCDLRGATFRNADLAGAFFLDCKLEGVVSDAPLAAR